MAKKISSKDLFESEDIFKGIRDSAEKTLISLNKINDEFKQTATTLKQSLGDAKFDSSDSIKKFTAATAEANKIQKQAIEIQKLQEQVRQQAIKSQKEEERLQQERIKTQKAEAQEKSRLAAESAKATKAAENEASAYSKLSKDLNNARKAYKDLAVQNQENTAEGQQLLKQVTDLDAQLKKVDATVGQHQRNVGNYEGATANLKTELRALTRELMNMSESDPKFQEMAQRAGELKDRIQDTQNVVKATAGSAMENLAGSVAKVGQIGVAAFQGMESSMVLLGVENEAVLQSMQRLQALAGLGDALKTLGGLGDMLTEIKAGFVAAAVKMGIFTATKQADTAATVVNTAATKTQGVAVATTSGIFTRMGAALKTTAIGQGLLTAATVLSTFVTSAATAGLKLFRLALVSTGIGALVVGVGLLIANFDKILGLFTPLIQGFKDFGDWIGITSYKQEEADKKAAKRAENRIAEMEKEQKKREKLQKSKETAYNSEDKALGRQINLLKAQGKDTTALERARLKATINYQTNLQNETFAIFNQNKEKNKLILSELRAIAVREKDFTEYNKFLLSSSATQNDIAAENAAANEARKDAINQLAIFEIETAKAQNESRSESVTHTEKTEKQKLDLTRQNTDKRISLMNEGFEKEQNIIKEKYKREKEDLIANSKDKIIDEQQFADAEYLIQENLEKELLVLTDKYDEIARKKRIEEAEFIKKNLEEIAEQERQTNIKTAQEELIFEDKKTKAKLSSLEGAEKEELEKRLAFQKELDELNQLKLDGAFASQEEYQKAVDLLEKKYFDKTKENEEKRKETIEAFATKTTEFLKKKSDEKIAQIDKEIAAAQKQSETLKALAESGNINAQQSLAENQRIIDQANLRKEKQLKKQQRIEAGLAIFKLFSANADKKNPLAATIKDTTGLLAFISSLPMFYDGTEDTGSNGQGIDGKGGFHAVLHPNERVLPKSLNEQIGSMSNEQLTKIAQEYQNGRLVSKSNANSSLELAVLASKLDTLTDVIKNKPETNIALGEITQSAMNIVESKRTGNTTIYNRFRISK